MAGRNDVRAQPFGAPLHVNAALAVDVLFQFMRSLCTRLRDNNEKIRAINTMAMW